MPRADPKRQSAGQFMSSATERILSVSHWGAPPRDASASLRLGLALGGCVLNCQSNKKMTGTIEACVCEMAPVDVAPGRQERLRS